MRQAGSSTLTTTASSKRRRSRLEPDEMLIGVLDLGTTKIACLIAALPVAGNGPPRLLGLGHHRADGIRAGMVSDLAKAADAVAAAIEAAEAQAGLRLERVLVAVGCGRPRVETFRARWGVRGTTVRPSDLAAAHTHAKTHAERDGRTLLHLHELGFHLDDGAAVDNPLGLPAEQLIVDFAAVTSEDVELRNVEVLLDRQYLDVSGFVATPFASGLAAATVDERETGCLVIDLGGGTSSFAVFAAGALVHADAIPSGGDHITLEICRVLVTERQHAERIKTLYGTVQAAGSDAYEPIPYPLAGEGNVPGELTTRAQLREIIRPMLERVLGDVRKRLEVAGMAPRYHTVVLTGGASQLDGLTGVAREIFGRPVRLGVPTVLSELPDAGNPILAAVAGALTVWHAPNVRIGLRLDDAGVAGTAGAAGYLIRMRRWLKASFWDDEQDRDVA